MVWQIKDIRAHILKLIDHLLEFNFEQSSFAIHEESLNNFDRSQFVFKHFLHVEETDNFLSPEIFIILQLSLEIKCHIGKMRLLAQILEDVISNMIYIVFINISINIAFLADKLLNIIFFYFIYLVHFLLFLILKCLWYLKDFVLLLDVFSFDDMAGIESISI